MIDDIEVVQDTPADGDLSSVASLIERTYQAERELAFLEEQVKAKKAQVLQLTERDLPEAMTRCGVRDFTTASGLRATVSTKFRCGQLDDAPDDPSKDAQRPLSERLDALNWLDEAGHGDLVKRVVAFTLGAGSSELAADIIRIVRANIGSNSMVIDHRRAVVWNTLSKFAREQHRDGFDPPLEKLGVMRVQQAKVTKEENT